MYALLEQGRHSNIYRPCLAPSFCISGLGFGNVECSKNSRSNANEAIFGLEKKAKDEA